jgi:hypothetical protein
MKEEAKMKISDGIEDRPSDRKLATSATDLNPADLPKLKQKSYEEIAFTKRIDIPHTKKIPINGRIFAIETSGTESKTESGIIIPHKYRS